MSSVPCSLELYFPPGDPWQLSFEPRAKSQRARPVPSCLVREVSNAAVGDAYQPLKGACRESLLGACWRVQVSFL